MTLVRQSRLRPRRAQDSPEARETDAREAFLKNHPDPFPQPRSNLRAHGHAAPPSPGKISLDNPDAMLDFRDEHSQ